MLYTTWHDTSDGAIWIFDVLSSRREQDKPLVGNFWPSHHRFIFFNNLLVSTALYGLLWSNDNESVFRMMGIMKVAISFVKYCPQVYLNWKRKSTEGWSLGNVILDFTGGLLSFIQIFVDTLNGESPDLFGSGLNLAKFLLGLLTIFFDSIFLFQHYILYNPKSMSYHREKLLPTSIDTINLSEQTFDGNNSEDTDLND